jgi:hypothetical protein
MREAFNVLSSGPITELTIARIRKANIQNAQSVLNEELGPNSFILNFDENGFEV